MWSVSDCFIVCFLFILFLFIFFEGIVYYLFVIGLMLFLFILVMVIFKVNVGIVISFVILFYIYFKGNMIWGIVFNEFGLIVIGIGVVLFVNLYMLSLD